jgi:hypothetical protein
MAIDVRYKADGYYRSNHLTLVWDTKTMSEQIKRAEKQGPFVLTPQNVQVSNPHNVSSVYANNIGAGGTLTDFSLYFIETGQLPFENRTITKQELKAAVTLPLALAEPLIRILQQIVDGHKSMVEKATEAAKASGKK